MAVARGDACARVRESPLHHRGARTTAARSKAGEAESARSREPGQYLRMPLAERRPVNGSQREEKTRGQACPERPIAQAACHSLARMGTCTLILRKGSSAGPLDCGIGARASRLIGDAPQCKVSSLASQYRAECVSRIRPCSSSTSRSRNEAGSPVSPVVHASAYLLHAKESCANYVRVRRDPDPFTVAKSNAVNGVTTTVDAKIPRRAPDWVWIVVPRTVDPTCGIYANASDAWSKRGTTTPTNR